MSVTVTHHVGNRITLGKWERCQRRKTASFLSGDWNSGRRRARDSRAGGGAAALLPKTTPRMPCRAFHGVCD